MTLPVGYRERFINVLMETGNVSRTAIALGINRMTAYEWREIDSGFAAAWDRAIEIARQNLRERVIETACALGIGRWIAMIDPLTGEPVLDEEFAPVMRFDTGHVDARILAKLMDKTMRDEVRQIDQRTQVEGHVSHKHYEIVFYDTDGARLPDPAAQDAEWTEIEDACP